MEKQFQIEEAYAYYIHRMDRMLKIHFQNMVKFHGIDITIEQWFILSKLYQKDGISQVELMDKIFKDKPNITRMIDGLEKKDLVRRNSDKSDRRKFLIVLTEKGREVTSRMIKIATAERKNVYRDLKKDDLATLKMIFEKMEANISHSPFFNSPKNRS